MAAVTEKGGMKLYFNGVLPGRFEHTGKPGDDLRHGKHNAVVGAFSRLGANDEARALLDAVPVPDPLAPGGRLSVAISVTKPCS